MRILSLFIFLSFAASAQVRPYQTARLISTGGTGVASLLVPESAVLNPAGVAFFGETFASYQKSTTSLGDKNDERAADGRRFANANFSEAAFVMDNSSDMKGGFSFQRQNENGFMRERMVLAAATKILDSVSLGVIVRHTRDNRPRWFSRHRHKTSNPVVVGTTWIPMESLTVGAIYEDVGNALKTESRAIAGLQYSITPDLVILGDYGGDPRADFADKHLWRYAGQFRIFSDFFLRAGQYKDHTINEQGIGYGVSWSGPKIGVDVAMKNGKQIEKEKGYFYPNEKITDFSFAVNMRF